MEGDEIRTVTIQRGEVDLTVEFEVWPNGFARLTRAFDEDGEDMDLSDAEWKTAYALVEAGVDETGR
jgi:hypothetical protein